MTNGSSGTRTRGTSYSAGTESAVRAMATNNIYSDAQWHWVADRLGEGYKMKDISDFLGMHPNNIRYNLCRIGRRLDYVNLSDLEDAKDEFLQLAVIGPANTKGARVIGVDAHGNEVRFVNLTDAAKWLNVSPADIYNSIKFKYKCHGYEWRKERTMRIREIDPGFRKYVIANDGYCPCMVEKTPDTKCMCKEFREQKEPGPCHCGRYEKYEEG